MNKFLINTPPGDRGDDGSTLDSVKHDKDCVDFVCLKDGTITGECSYCDLSLVCQQIDILPNGKSISMESHYVPVIDAVSGDVLEWELYCTGMHEDLFKAKTQLPDKVS